MTIPPVSAHPPAPLAVAPTTKPSAVQEAIREAQTGITDGDESTGSKFSAVA